MGGEIVFNNSKKETIENEIKKKIMEIISLNEEISEIEFQIEERRKIIEQMINEIYKRKKRLKKSKI